MVDIIRPNFGTVWAASGEKLSPTEIKIQGGWIQEMMPYQYQNFLQNRVDNAITYLLQKGVPEWDASQEYTANKSVVTYAGQMYMALTTNTNVLPTLTASWKRLTITFGANGAIPITLGGTGATTAADARTNLGIGSAATANLPVTNGLVVKLADNSLVALSITGTTGYITVTNPDGVSGSPTINVGANVAKTDADAAWTTKTSIKIPSGTSSERGVGAPGRIRFNMESGVYEGYDNTGWNPIGSTGTLDVQNFSGDGVKTSFTMSTTPRAENNTQVYFNGVYQQKNSYNLVGSNLVFDEAPALGIEIEVVTVSSVAIGTTTAGQTSIVDVGDYYTSNNVEGALQEAASIATPAGTVPLKGYVESTRNDVDVLKNNSAKLVTSYAELDAYTGVGTVVDIVSAAALSSPSGIIGRFVISPANGAVVPDGGVVRRLRDGRIARRQGVVQVLTSWWGNDQIATQSAIDYAYGKTATVLINTHQTWTSPVVVKHGIKLRGLGVDVLGSGGTKITYTGTTDCLVMQNPVNTSNPSNIDIEGIWFAAFSLADNCGVIFDTASSVLKIRKCRFNAKNCIILDQTEISDIYDCSFAIGDGYNHCGVWIVNGPDKNPGSEPFWTNRISIKKCEFNGGLGSVFIWDDGGVSHVFEDNNYNGAGAHIIATGVNSLRITGGEYELNSYPAIIFSLSKRNGASGAKCTTVSVNDTYYWAMTDIPFIASVEGAIGHLNVTTNFINCPGTVFSGLNVACDSIRAEGNVQVGTGDGKSIINNYYDAVVCPIEWQADTSPTVGNGTLVAVKSRKGKELTYRIFLEFGSTTSSGTGSWYFPLPHKANTQSALFTVGSASALIVGKSGYALASNITSDGMRMYIQTNSATPIAGAGVPAIWTTGSSLKAQIVYDAENLI